MTKTARRTAICFSCCIGVAFPAAAQEARRATLLSPNEVLSRAKPEYDQVGFRAGGFKILPDVDVKAIYDDNVYASDILKRGDASALATATVDVQSNWNRNSLTVRGQVSAERFAKQTTQNNETASLLVNGTYDISREIAVDASARIAHLVEPRGSQGDAFIGGTPSQYGYKQIGGAVRAMPGKLDLRVAADIGDYAYQDVRFGNVRISQDYRDRTEANASARAAYSLSPNIAGYIKGSYANARYENNQSGFKLDSDVTSVVGGVDFTISRLIVGYAGVGYIKQKFDDPRFRDVSGFAYDGRIVYNPTTLLSVTLSGSSTVQQSGIIGVGGVLQRDIKLQADYELLRNFVVHAQGGAIHRDYRGIDRTDNYAEGQIGGTYLLNRQMSFDLSYEHIEQGSHGVQRRDYASNRVLFGVRLRR